MTVSVFRYTGLFMPPGGSKPEPPEPSVIWELIASGVGSGGNTVTTSVALGSTTSANVIVLIISLHESGLPFSITDNLGNAFSILQTISIQPSLVFAWVNHPVTGTNHQITVSASGSPIYPAIVAYAFRDDSFKGNLNYGNLYISGLSGSSIQPEHPMLITVKNTLVVSALAMSGSSAHVPTAPPSNYGGLLVRPGTNGPNYGAASAYRLITAVPSSERPVWNTAGSGALRTGLLSLSGAAPFVLKSTAYMQSVTSSVTVTLDTRDATLIVLCAGGFFGDVATGITPYPAITATNAPYFMLGTPNNPYIGMRVISFLNPSITSANHQFTVAMNRPDSPDPSTPSIRALVFHSTGTVSRETVGGNAVANAASIQSTTAANINFPNALLITAAMTNVSGSPFVSPGGFEIFFQASTRYPMAVGIRFPFNPSTENPIWQTTASGQLSTSLISFKSS